ncbi:hypothetical protein EJV47_05040 [Hymenobacter gummosus]|uniref:Uncharacterized protein n=1 Tax=Hymenobacter gummosus TaxID=1776032 RepID=A0A3S0H7M2_9BACT|nr:hypothetical protein [Hymenobacter gummosus]RTQ52382.1 hypothetical protein EJV47_05040 [Hymenobacter gummosus]
MSDEELEQSLARAHQAIDIIRNIIRPYSEPFSPEERAGLRRLLAQPGPRLVGPPAPDSDLGRLYAQVRQLHAQMEGVGELAAVQQQMADLLLDVYAALLAQVSQRYGVPLPVQQSVALLLAN